MLGAPLRLLCLASLALLPTSAAVADAEHGMWPAKLSNAAAAMEYWDLSARLDSGHFVFARFLITNEGPGAHTAAGLGTLIQPDGSVVPFRYGRREGEWTLSPDRQMIDIASLTLDWRSQPRRFEMDSDKRGIKIHLSFPTAGPIVWAQTAATEAHRSDVLELGAPIAGSLWVAGMPEAVTTRGTVTLTHAWMDPSESDLVLRQVEVMVQDAGLSAYAAEFVAPDGRKRAWMALRKDGELLPRGEAVAAVVELGADGSRPGYAPATRVSFRNRHAALLATPRRELLRLDPTEVIPQPFRFILSLKMRPQRITADAHCEITLGDAATPSEHPCLVAVTYLNPASAAPR